MGCSLAKRKKTEEEERISREIDAQIELDKRMRKMETNIKILFLGKIFYSNQKNIGSNRQDKMKSCA